MSALPMASPAAAEDVAALTRRIRLLVAVTISYNVIEAVVAIAAGAVASSTALIGFGLDSVIEVCSASAVAWQFTARQHALRQAREQAALRVTAMSFLALSIYLLVEALRELTGGSAAEHSGVGIALAVLSLLVMPIVSVAQRRAGRRLGSASAVADSKQTLLCTYLSAVLLVGLLANTLFGWAWADPLAGLVIAVIAAREGVNAWRGESCCAIPVATEALAPRHLQDTSRAAIGCCREENQPSGSGGQPIVGRVRWRRSSSVGVSLSVEAEASRTPPAAPSDCCR